VEWLVVQCMMVVGGGVVGGAALVAVEPCWGISQLSVFAMVLRSGGTR
jgi:hypothetical protein